MTTAAQYTDWSEEEKDQHPDRSTAKRTTIIDCDVHNAVPADTVLKSYLPHRWRSHLEYVGYRGYHSWSREYAYPKATPGGGARTDAWPASGGLPGSDLHLMRNQLLDRYGIRIAVLNCLSRAAEQLNDQFGAALTSAINDWQVEHWLEQDDRLRASLVIPYEAGDLAAAEIDRAATVEGFVQILLFPRTREPLGRRRYWPIYEAAERNDLPIGIHFAGIPGGPITPSGWPSYYIEDHTVMSQAFQAQITSLVCEGVFEKFPSLRVALVEGGFGWLPALMWRLDNLFEQLYTEVPHLSKRPSEYIRQHMRLTTQPMEEPETPRHLHDVIEQLGHNMLMFSTDYPHWDFDEPRRVFPTKLPRDLKNRIFHDNAAEFYRL